MADVDMSALYTRGNYFAERSFVKTDIQGGVTRNRSGTRIVSLTSDFLKGLRNAMFQECGPAANMVLTTCGKSWGRMFAQRFEREMTEFYGAPFRQAPVVFFETCLSEAFSHHGWGKFQIDYTRTHQGIIVIQIEHPPFEGLVENPEEPVESLLSGIIAGIFSHFTGQDLACLQTDCTQCGDAIDRFVMTLSSRIDKPRDLKSSGKGFDEIIAVMEKSVA